MFRYDTQLSNEPPMSKSPQKKSRTRTPEQAELDRRRCREYYAANRERCRQRSQQWRAANHERAAAVAAEYRKNNGHKRRAHYAANKQARNRWHYAYQKAKAAADPQFCAYRKIVLMIGRAMQKHRSGRKITNKSRIVQLLGCEWHEFIAHVESQFQPGMTWANHGLRGWHFDHIRPLSSFDLTDDAERLKGCNYTNVQPLWAADNVRKGGRIA